MTFTPAQKKEAYKKLLPKVQDFIMDNETTELVSKFLEESELTREQTEQADSEILYALLNLQTLDQAINNIATLSQKNISNFADLKEKLEKNIFSKIYRPNQDTNKTSLEPKNNKINRVGNSFEETILNQARGMQPAVVPDNLPTNDNQSEINNQPKKIHDYKPGTDPYREPVT